MNRVVAPAGLRTIRTGLVGLVSTALALSVLVASVLVVSVVVGGAAPASAARNPFVRSPMERHLGWVVRGVLNRERAAHGLAPLHMDSRLGAAARRHDINMARVDLMSHQVSGEADVASRVLQAGYPWTWLGENIGWNSTMTRRGVVSLERAMYNEQAPNDGHRLNILGRHFSDVGVDVYLDHVHHKVWLTVDFAHQ